ncbi:MAG: hypothetical protein V3V33_12555 [Candidatus Lokiarchaeia archaeon]
MAENKIIEELLEKVNTISTKLKIIESKTREDTCRHSLRPNASFGDRKLIELVEIEKKLHLKLQFCTKCGGVFVKIQG